MTENSRFFTRFCPITLLAMFACTGCQNCDCAGNDPVGGKIFPYRDEDARDVNRTIAVQTSRAAARDATLRPYHFDGPTLNSLGAQKLDLMARAERGDVPLTVYLDIGQEPDQDQRRESVLAYLKDRGLRDEQIKIEAGSNPNPDNQTPAAPQMRMQHLLDAGAPVAQNPEPSGVTVMQPGATSAGH